MSVCANGMFIYTNVDTVHEDALCMCSHTTHITEYINTCDNKNCSSESVHLFQRKCFFSILTRYSMCCIVFVECLACENVRSMSLQTVCLYMYMYNVYLCSCMRVESMDVYVHAHIYKYSSMFRAFV